MIYKEIKQTENKIIKVIHFNTSDKDYVAKLTELFDFAIEKESKPNTENPAITVFTDNASVLKELDDAVFLSTRTCQKFILTLEMII